MRKSLESIFIGNSEKVTSEKEIHQNSDVWIKSDLNIKFNLVEIISVDRFEWIERYL